MERRFSVDAEGMEACQSFVASCCASPRPQIIMDEIVSNIVRCSGATFFTVDFSTDPSGLSSLVFTDDGVAFNPLSVSAPDVSASAADREIGGLGIFMVRKMSKSVSYERRNEHNVLTIQLQL